MKIIQRNCFKIFAYVLALFLLLDIIAVLVVLPKDYLANFLFNLTQRTSSVPRFIRVFPGLKGKCPVLDGTVNDLLALRFVDPPLLYPMALASFPGSGNTWVRHLLQQATGLATGSVYHDKELIRLGFPGEEIFDGKVLVVKTHESPLDISPQYDRAVLLIRHPCDALLAEFHRQWSKVHYGHATTEHFNKYWKEYFYSEIASWERWNTLWIKYFNGPMHVVWYEDLQRNLTTTLSELLRFLNVDVTKHGLACARENPGFQFRRKKKKNVTDGLFTREMTSLAMMTEYKVLLRAFRNRRARPVLDPNAF